jgi:glycosyltransferase involved in cell wall biosynthesis
MPKVSVVIPCFNHGQFVDDAVSSVLAQSYNDYEIIVVNDGSTDQETNRLLETYSRKDTHVITTDNQGLAGARNNGIAASSGKYILPLDADDCIEPKYLEQAVAVLERDPEVGIVYCNARLFGAVETAWVLPEYSIEKMLVDNVIFCSAFFRRTDWEAVGGYDPGMIYGWEDYEFWLSLIEAGKGVFKIPETLFAYRVASDSMVRSREKWQKVEMFKRIYLKHQDLFSSNIGVWINAVLDSGDKYFTSRLYVDCGSGISDRSSVSRKIEAGTRKIVFDLRDFNNITALRFDPVDTWAVVEIGKVLAKYRSGEMKDLTILETNALYNQRGKLLFDTEDPQCFLGEPGSAELSDIVELTVELQFIALADQALEHIVCFQKDALRRLGEEGLPQKLQNAGRTILRSFTKTK